MESNVKDDKKQAYAGIYNRLIKRGLDILFSGVILLIIWPILLVVAVAVAIDDGFPVFYRAKRGGFMGREFKICKFRTMVNNADKLGGGTTALNDPRITKVGVFLRKTKLDELPQFGQVFLGKMSIIGPRPELLRYTQQYRGEEMDILKVRPGITDYSSIEFVNLDEIVGGENADEMYEKLVLPRKNELRVRYAHTVSFATDMKLFFGTARAVLHKAFGFIFRKEHR